MSRRNWTMTAAMAVAMVMLMVLTSVRVKGIGEEFTEVNSADHPIKLTVEDVWAPCVGMPDSRKAIAWYGNEVFLAVSRNETSGDYGSYLYHSPDGGETWDDPVQVLQKNDIVAIKNEILIFDDYMYYVYFIRTKWHEENDYDDYITRSIYCYVLPVHDWINISQYTPQRMDDQYNGYLANHQLLEFKGDVYLFWLRSHYMEIVYKRFIHGAWSDTMFLSTGTRHSNFAAISSNISGTERLHFVYQYYPENAIYTTYSTNGVDWTTPSKIWMHDDSILRISMTEWKGRLHLAVTEFFGYDVYHSWSPDGSSWVPFMKIGENTASDLLRLEPPTQSVVISGSPAIDRLLVAFDTNCGIEMVGSKDNGDSFQVMARFKNDSAFYPSFCSRGIFLMYGDSDHVLTVRKLGPSSTTVPPDNDTPSEDNSTTPPDDNSTTPPDDNSTTPPDDNSTTPPDDNSTTPPDDNSTPPPDDNSTTPPDNGTDDGPDDVTPPSDNNPPDEPEMIFMEGGFYEGAKIIVRGSGQDPDENDTDLNYTWYIEGMGVVGYGTCLKLELQAGTYTLTLKVADEHGAYSETVRTIIVKAGSGESGPEEKPDGSDIIEAFGFTIALLFLLMIAMAVIMTRMSFLRRSTVRKPEKRRGPYISGSDLEGGGVAAAQSGMRVPPIAMTIGKIPSGASRTEPSFHNHEEEVRTGTLDDDHVFRPRMLEAPEPLDGIRGAVEAKGFRSTTEIEGLKRKAEMKKGELPQNVYQEITEILEGYGR